MTIMASLVRSNTNCMDLNDNNFMSEHLNFD